MSGSLAQSYSRNINPSDISEVVGEFAVASPAQVDLAIAAARIELWRA